MSAWLLFYGGSTALKYRNRRPFSIRGARWSGLRVRSGIAIALALAVASQLFGDWEKTHEWNSPALDSAVVSSPSDPNRTYAIPGNTAWLLYSVDAGLTWQRTAAIGSRVVITRVAVDPLHSDTIYASISSATPVPGLYKSTNGGNSFVPLDNGLMTGMFGYFTRVAIDPQDPNTLYASASSGSVLKSRDGGLTWSQTARVDSSVFALAIDLNNPLIVYASGYDAPLSRQTGGLYRTMDGGLTWPSIFPGLTYIGYLTVDAHSRVYAIAQVMFETPLYRSTNHGELWSRLPVNPRFSLSAVVPDPRRPETLYVSSLGNAAESETGVKNPGVLVSYDDGATWQPLGDFPDRLVNTIAVTPDGVVLAAARTGIWRYVTPPPPPTRRRAVATRGGR